MKYKALILDLDGTTVANKRNGLPSKKVTQAISKLKNKITVCVATGRPYFFAKSILDSLELTGPCILNNGTQFYDPKTKSIIEEIKLDKKIIPEIYKIYKKHKIEVYTFDGFEEVAYKGNGQPEKTLGMFAPNLEEKLADQIMKELDELPATLTHKMLSHNKDSFDLETTHSSASKLHGIKEVSKILKIEPHEIIGVGDGYNDFPLLLACGLKFAMGNAVPELKAIADFVAPSVNRDGVAVIIEKFILPVLG